MKIYTLTRSHKLPISLGEAWRFFSDPANLGAITPGYMNFKICYQSGEARMYPGQIIQYRVNIFPLLRLSWVTEITHVSEPYFFVDEQRFGPYKFWHHQHRFTQTTGGVEMTDIVNYGLPFGIFGRMVHALFVKRRLNTIFDHRNSVLRTLFGKRTLRTSAE